MSSLKDQLKVAAHALKDASSLVILSHINPDGDAVSSTCGLAAAARLQGKSVAMVNTDPVPEYLRFLPLAEEIEDKLPPLEGALLVFCDCGDRKRVGDEMAALVPKGHQLLNIDHHISNTLFGDINLVDSSASSTAEVIFHLLRELGWTITSEIATTLITGIISDTGGFRYRSSSVVTLEAAVELCKAGGDIHYVVEKLFSEMPLRKVRLQAAALDQLELFFDERVAMAVVDQGVLDRTGSDFRDSEGLAERMRDIKGVEVSVLLRWDGERWRVSLRGVGQKHNLAVLAERFGGGGHVAAAAFRYRGELSTLRELLMKGLTDLMGHADRRGGQ